MTWYDYKDWMFVLVGQSHRVTAFRQNQNSKWPDYFDCFKHPTLMAQANDFVDVSRLRYKVLKAQAWPNSGKAIPHDGGRHAAVAAVANGSNLDPAVAEVEVNLHGAADHQDDACLHYFIGTGRGFRRPQKWICMVRGLRNGFAWSEASARRIRRPCKCQLASRSGSRTHLRLG